jgi:phosphomannomutase
MDRLYALYSRLGYWGSAQQSLVRTGVDGAAALRKIVERIAANPPTELAGLRFEAQRDFRRDAERRPAWLGESSLIEFRFQGGSRVLVRPSGTEPKLKVYVDYREPSTPSEQLGTPLARLERARLEAQAVAEAMIRQLSAYSES